MRRLLEILDLKPSDILFFGDQLNEGCNDFPVKTTCWLFVSS
jgi:hypothetical protein